MKIDVVTILYNSQKWLSGYLHSFLKSKYDLADINLFFIDNNPSEDYKSIIEDHPVIQKLGSFTFINNKENVGFGVANNQGAALGSAPYVFFLNIDTELMPTALSELERSITQSASEVGAWEMRQFPYEHPKIYHPVTQYTSWASAAALCIRRDVFDSVGGFDKNIFMYAEDVDISWAIRSRGYKIRYCPCSVVYHYSYTDVNEVKPTQFYYSLYNNLMLRFKYGSIRNIIDGYNWVNRIRKSSNPVLPNQKQEIKTLFKDSFSKGMAFRKRNNQKQFKPQFFELDYERTRSGAFFENKPWSGFDVLPKISVIVRTHKRPLVLEEALISLMNQTYPNIEVVVVEDGQNTARQIIDQYSSKLNLQYHYTGKQGGRSVAGNLAMSKATGDYLAFLDDDDLVYADHFETLMNVMLNGKHDIVHAPAFCVTTDVKSNNPYEYTELNYSLLHNIPFSKEDLINFNLFPIQAVLFKKTFFDRLGGFDTSIEYLEDWALWLKYMWDANVGYADKVTSLYRIPANKSSFKTRHKQLLSTRQYVLDNYGVNYLQERNKSALSLTVLQGSAPLNPKTVVCRIDHLGFKQNCIALAGWAIIENESFDQAFLKVNQKGEFRYYKIQLSIRDDIKRKYKLKDNRPGIWANIQLSESFSGFIPFSIVLIKNNRFAEVKITKLVYFKTFVLKLRKFAILHLLRP